MIFHSKDSINYMYVKILLLIIILQVLTYHSYHYRLPIFVRVSKTPLDKKLGLAQYKWDLKEKVYMSFSLCTYM